MQLNIHQMGKMLSLKFKLVLVHTTKKVVIIAMTANAIPCNDITKMVLKQNL
jgi:hypothetical protein